MISAGLGDAELKAFPFASVREVDTDSTSVPSVFCLLSEASVVEGVLFRLAFAFASSLLGVLAGNS